MLILKDLYILQGSFVDVSWALNQETKHLYIWYPVSWLPWRNYTPVSSNGIMQVQVLEDVFKIKLKKLTFLGFKTLYTIKRDVHRIKINDIESSISLVKSAKIYNHRKWNVDVSRIHLFKKPQSIHLSTLNVLPKIKSVSLKNISSLNS